jgi:hypothetical protein
MRGKSGSIPVASCVLLCAGHTAIGYAGRPEMACEFVRSKSLLDRPDFRFRACGYTADKLARRRAAA